MKKHITLLSGLLFVSGAFAQNTKIATSPRVTNKFTTEAVKPAPSTQSDKALGAIIWSSNFSNPGDWVINNDGQTGGNFGWNINATKEGWPNNTTLGIIASTSGGNYAELGNGNPTLTPGTQKLDVDYYLTTANPMTISSQDLSLSFLQNGAKFYDLQEFQISVDGTTWITVGNNSDKAMLSLSGGAPYPNPDKVNVNLSSFIPAGSTQLWVRFHWTTDRPDAATNPNVWVTYGWNIDDVVVSELPDYDLAITNDYWGSEGLGYFQIPTTQTAPIDYSINVRNDGSSPMTNVKYNIAVTGAGTFNGSSAPGTVAVGATNDSLFLTTAFTPTAVGTYNVARSLTADDADDVPSNNPLTNFSFKVTDYIYARDNDVPDGYSTNQADPFEVGNFFDIWTPQTLKGLDVRFDAETPVTSQVYVRLYKIVPGQQKPVYVMESADIELTAAQINTNLTILFNSPVALTANTTYLAMVGTYSPDVTVANAGYSPDQTSFLLDGIDMQTATLYYQNETPMVRMNFDPTLAVTELTSATEVSVFPNPFVGTTEIKFNLKADSQVSVVITDLAGRTVASVPASNMNAGEQTISIDGSSFVAGIYNYTLKVGNETITKRIVKK